MGAAALVRARVGALQDPHRLLLIPSASPIFAPLAPALAKLPAGRWPTHGELTALAQGIVTSRGKPLRFVPPRGQRDEERRHYEVRIADSGEVETRAQSWHDLFNALAWITFPRAKAAINGQHAALLEERGEAEARRRGPERDALTLFDEGGVVVACSDAALRELVAERRWKELFWHRRRDVAARMRFFAFGHALCEKALEPYIGIVARTVFVPFAEEAAGVDVPLAAHFADRDRFHAPAAMPPMPILGIPGWHPRTGEEAFYDDAAHFRGP